MPSELNMHSQHCVDLLLNGLKVAEGIPFPDRKILHSIIIHDGCIIINVTKVLNGDLPLPYASVGVDTLSEAVGGFIQWHTSQIVNHIRPSLQHNEMTRSQDHIVMSDNMSSFIPRKVKLLHKCSECKDCIAIALVTNVNEEDWRNAFGCFLLWCCCGRSVALLYGLLSRVK